MTRSRWATLLAVAALAATGCGGDDDEGEPAGGGEATTTEQTEPNTATGGLEDTTTAGLETFATTCGGCHTLKAADTSGTTGPNLDELKPDKERVLTAIREGPSVMPENLLEGTEAEQVAEFVAAAAGNASN